jgi:hypothetical protein
MRNLFYIALFLCSAALIISCKKSESSASIVGKWRYSKYRVKAVSSNPINNLDTTVVLNVPSYLNFNTSGTYEFTCDTCTSNDTGTYSVSNNKLILNNSSNSDTFDIQKLANTELNLYRRENFDPTNYYDIWLFMTR